MVSGGDVVKSAGPWAESKPLEPGVEVTAL